MTTRLARRSCSACRADWHGHIEDTASIATLDRARRGARGDARPPRRRLLRARALVDRQGGARARARAAPRSVDDAYRMRADLLDASDACAVVATVGTTSIDVGRIRCAEIARAARATPGCTSTPRTPAPRGSVPSTAGRRTASSARTRSSSTRTSGCSRGWAARCLWTSRPEDFRRAFSLVPEYLRTPDEVLSLSEVTDPARPAVPRAAAVGGAALLRAREGLQAQHPRARAARRAVRGVGARRAGLGAVRAATVLASSASAATARDEENEALLERVNATRRDLHLAHEARRPLRPAARGRQRAHDGGRRAARVGGAARCAP